ncbi:hypothetical protein H9P43_000294 [Blastocladiella emersonii ATCC 22665]|nr:hypothetical protein H9P43_000278 [Blastocladiella emersonii ATCC 22665]KAI9188872.1 hypothetical protein H9P43_000294 [Blastocladiella emersonii ATCC 22665]
MCNSLVPPGPDYDDHNDEEYTKYDYLDGPGTSTVQAIPSPSPFSPRQQLQHYHQQQHHHHLQAEPWPPHAMLPSPSPPPPSQAPVQYAHVDLSDEDKHKHPEAYTDTPLAPRPPLTVVVTKSLHGRSSMPTITGTKYERGGQVVVVTEWDGEMQAVDAWVRARRVERTPSM